MQNVIPEAREQRFSVWHNPTDRDIVLNLHVGATRENPSGKVRHTVPAKGSKTIPSEFDMAIQHVRDDMIVGGFAPQLRREGGSERLHQSLDDSEARRKEALEDATVALKNRRNAEDAFVLAQARIEAAKNPEGDASKAAPVTPPAKKG